jgi:dethiobiotin synthetase
MKPIETGCMIKDGMLIPSDGTLLRDAAELDLPIDHIVPIRYRTPVAPLVAAREEGREVILENIREAYKRLAEADFDLIVVEGAGGLMVPILHQLQGYFMLDLAKDLNIPILLVAGTRLGTINHTLLSVRCAGVSAIPVVGVMLNQIVPPVQDIAEQSNPAILRELLDIPVFGPFPYCPEPSIDAIDEILQQRDLFENVLETILGYSDRPFL